MTGVAWILLLIGVVFMIGSFFVTEKLSPSELNQIAELSEEELKRIIDRGLKNAETRIEDAIDEQVDQSSEKVDRSLEKVTNDKIMAISEYSLCRAQVLLCQGGQQLHRGTGSGRGGAVPEVPAAPADPPHQAVDGILIGGSAL